MIITSIQLSNLTLLSHIQQYRNNVEIKFDLPVANMGGNKKQKQGYL